MSEKKSKALRALRDDPVLFVEKVLSAKPEPEQLQILQAAAPEGSKVSVRSGHGIGKTTALAWLILWFLGTRRDVKIPCTAPSGSTLNDALWAELGKWLDKMPKEWSSQYKLTKDRLVIVGLERVNFAVARTARRETPEALAGFHAKHILFIIDEASGVEEPIFQTAEGALSTRGARVVMTSNPTRTSGYFYDSHHSERLYWTPLHFSAEDSNLVDPLWIERASRKYGKDSNYWRVRVKGMFPASEADQFIPLELLDAAKVRDWVEPSGPMIWGVDPAHFGDNRTVLAKRKGGKLYPLKSVRRYDTMQTVSWIIEEWRNTPEHERPEWIYVDSIGVGAGVADRLRQLRFPVVGVNVCERPSSHDRFHDLRAELWGAFKNWLLNGTSSIPNDENLIGEASIIKFDWDSHHKMVMESKKKMRERNVASPDHADAVVLTFFNDVGMVDEGLLAEDDDHPITAVMDYDPLAELNTGAMPCLQEPHLCQLSPQPRLSKSLTRPHWTLRRRRMPERWPDVGAVPPLALSSVRGFTDQGCPRWHVKHC